MTISGNISTQTYEIKRAGLGVLALKQTVPINVDGAVWPCGLILGKGPVSGYAPYDDIVVSLGTGDGAVKDFTGDVRSIKAGTLQITDGSVALTDDGFGGLTGSGATGSVNYKTGKISVSFTAAPAADADISVTYKPMPWAVLDAETDTSEQSSALAVLMGNVRKSDLKLGVAAPADADAGSIALLAERHIYAV